MARWNKINARGKVDDRRNMAPVVGGIGLTGVAVLFAINLLTGGEYADILGSIAQQAAQTQTTQTTTEYSGEDPYEVFASTVLGSNNTLWQQKFNSLDQNYTEPTLVLFRQATRSACGTATSSVGPHYCPLDQTIYLDETFFDALEQKFNAQGGDVAEAYVIAHEVAHHLQYQLGIMDQVNQQRNTSPHLGNELSILLELQADCLAGVWANSLQDRNILMPGEIKEAMDAAAAVGDDRIQETVTGQINPETWTHGSSQQRLEWFNRGYDSGSVAACDTFSQ